MNFEKKTPENRDTVIDIGRDVSGCVATIKLSNKLCMSDLHCLTCIINETRT